MEPVSSSKYRTAQGDEDDQQDETAAASRAGKSSPEAKAPLQPVEEDVQKSQFE
jgi:hypothetical protein